MRGEPETINLETLLGNSEKTLVAAAHELKAPLSLIRMYAAHLDEENLTPAERKKYQTRLLFTAEQMLQLTNGLVAGQHWEPGQLPLEPVNTSIICQEILHELSPAAKELDQNLIFTPKSRPDVAISHGQTLRNLVFNLVFNSLKHTPAGSHVTLTTAKKADQVNINVFDTGPGFDKQLRTYFNRGVNGQFQAEPDRPGSGLGLAVARQLAQSINGSLQLKKHHRGGYCLLSLPASRQLSLPILN